VRLFDAQHHERLRDVIRQLGLIVKIQLLEALQDVVQTAQTASPLLVSALHR